MTETKLKPCPFCGGEAVMLGEDDGMYQVVCPNCAANIDNYDDEKEVAAEKWNSRPIEDELDKKNGCLIGTCHDLHDIVEDFRAECDQKDLEIKHLREALEVILEATKDEKPCITAINMVAYMALKGKE